MSKPSPTAAKTISAVVGVASLLVLVQAFLGGSLAHKATKGLTNAHQGIAYLLLVLSVGAVVLAVMQWRGTTGGQVVLGETVAFLILVIVQIGLGQQLKKGGSTGTHGGLLAIHIPVALLLFGISLHLSTYVANLRRSRI
jgi:hypothetical protein